MTIFTIGIPHVSPPVSLLNSPRNPGGVEPWGVEDGLSLATAGVHPKKIHGGCTEARDWKGIYT